MKSVYWLCDELMQQIAQENNLSERAFFVKEAEVYHLRWFPPTSEVEMSGKAVKYLEGIISF